MASDSQCGATGFLCQPGKLAISWLGGAGFALYNGARAIVRATTHFRDPAVLAEVSRGLGDAMPGIETSSLPESELMQNRGW